MPSRKNELLNKLSDRELRELATTISQRPIGGSVGRGTLTKTVKETLSLEEIKRRSLEIGEKIRDDARKDRILSKLDAASISELAEDVWPTKALPPRTSRAAIIKAIKESLSIEEMRSMISQDKENAKRKILEEEERARIAAKEREERARMTAKADKILSKLDRSQLIELAQPVLNDSVGIKMNRFTLTKKIKESTAIWEIESRANRIKRKERKIKRARQLAALRRNKVLAVFLLSVIVYSSLTLSSIVAYADWSRTSYAPPLEEEWSTRLATYGDYAFTVAQETQDGGFIMAGTSKIQGGLRCVLLLKIDADGNVEWSKTFSEYSFTPQVIRQTSDGAYILLGSPGVFPMFEYATTVIVNYSCCFLVKMDSAGDVQWNSRVSLPYLSYVGSLEQTSDGGYILAESDSSRSYVSKLDSDGIVQWGRMLNASDCMYRVSSILQTPDGGYVLAGSANCGEGRNWDFWLAKIGSLGGMEWNWTYGGAYDDLGCSIQPDRDNGYVMLGETWSFGAGGSDAWLIKVDSYGSIEWNRTYGSAYSEFPLLVFKTSDGGYAMAGDDSAGFWITKIDSNGTQQHSQTYRSVENALMSMSCAFQASDGCYVLVGTLSLSWTIGWDSSVVIKADSNGAVQWTRLFGGWRSSIWIKVYFGTPAPISPEIVQERIGNSSKEIILLPIYSVMDFEYSSVLQTSDGGYIVAGTTCRLDQGGTDIVVARTDSKGGVQWTKIYGGTYFDFAVSILETSDGGYAILGATCSFGAGGIDTWLIKTDSVGTVQWNKTYGGSGDDCPSCFAQARDGGFILVGDSGPFGWPDRVWILKADRAGTVEWNATIGGPGLLHVSSVAAAYGGGYVFAGWGSPLTPSNYSCCIWFATVDPFGRVLINETLDQFGESRGVFAAPAADGDFIVGGSVYRQDTGLDFLLVELDASGTVRWNRSYGRGGYWDDVPAHVPGCFLQTSDGYLIAGTPGVSPLSGSGGAYEKSELWLVKTDLDGIVQWDMTLLLAGYASSLSIQQSREGDYVLAGYWGASASDVCGLWLAKLHRPPPRLESVMFVGGLAGMTVLFVSSIALLFRKEEAKRSTSRVLADSAS